MRRLLPLISVVSMGLVSGCAPPEDEPVAGATGEAIVISPQLRFGDDAVSHLTSSRQALLAGLASASSRPPDIVLDAQSQAILQLQLSWSAGRPTARDNALRFVELFQPLLDPRVSASEYRVGTTSISCDELVVVLDRVISGKPVVGSRLTLHFDDTGRLISVVNGVAPVPAVRLPISNPSALPGATPLSRLMGNIPLQGAKRVPVMVPMANGSGVFDGELATWPDGDRYYAAVAIGNVAVSARLDAQGQGAGRSAGTAPRISSGSGTDVPSQVSYRDLGGMKVSFLGGERNPLEAAYRFLEEHATLFRTGAARCQYLPVRFSENPTVPGVFSARFAQRHGHLPVFGSEIVVRLEGLDRVQAVFARARGVIEVDPTPVLTSANAVSEARRVLQDGLALDPASTAEVTQALAMAATTRLGVLPGFASQAAQLRSDRLVWRVQQGHFTLFIDAGDGRVIAGVTGRQPVNIVKDGLGGSEWSYLSYPDAEIDGVAQPGAPTPPNSDVSPGLPGGAVSLSMSNLEALYTRNGWRGLYGDGRGDFIASTNVALGGGCPNAMFEATLTDSAFFCLGLATVDIVGHEFTHGVIAHSSGLVYADQSGAINEAYADLFGNLNQPPSTDWLVGESSVIGAFRDMMNPGGFGQPGHMSGYVPRPGTCQPWPWSCDAGGVHTNSGILNRAHALLSDGLAGFVVGIGREKLERLAFRVMTEELPASATLNQVAGATRDACEMFVARGITTFPSGLSFTTSDCDSVTNAFNQVGLNPSLWSGWAEPTLGFAGVDPLFPDSPLGVPAVTPGGCPVSNILLEHRVPGLGPSLFADYSPTTPLGPGTRLLDFVARTDFVLAGVPVTGAGPLPLGTQRMFHRVAWSSVYGVSPTYSTNVIYPATCSPPAVVESTSDTFTEGFDTGTWWGTSTRNVGNPMLVSPPPGCTLTGWALELLDAGGGRIGTGPGPSVQHTITAWILFIPVDFTMRAWIVAPPPGGTNFSGTVGLSWDLGRTVRTRWRYTFTAPAGTPCNAR
jgi:Zn-dependent metalloprotease